MAVKPPPDLNCNGHPFPVIQKKSIIYLSTRICMDYTKAVSDLQIHFMYQNYLTVTCKRLINFAKSVSQYIQCTKTQFITVWYYRVIAMSTLGPSNWILWRWTLYFRRWTCWWNLLQTMLGKTLPNEKYSDHTQMQFILQTSFHFSVYIICPVDVLEIVIS